MIELDYKIFKIINQGFPSERWDYWMGFVSSEAFGILFAIFLFLYAALRRDRTLLITLLLAAVSLAVVDFFSYQYLKPFFARVRPCQQTLIEVRQVFGCAGLYGFPSNHAANGMAVAATLYFFSYKRLALAAGVIALLVGFSRIYLGVHYPGDILGGYLTGILVAGLLAYVCRPLRLKFYT